MSDGKTVQKWADHAMFTAEPIKAAEGPKVYLLSMTPDPLGSIAAACKMYKGEVVRDLSDVTDAERVEYFEQVQKTKLQAPFEFVQFHFMIEGVTRAFTHQMVRQRTAVYAQESLRFAVKEDMPVGLPPSLAGTTGEWGSTYDRSQLSDAEKMRATWDEAKFAIDEAYGHLVASGMPAEDARGLLPHNVLTRLHYSTNLRNLLDHAGNRLCTQAQFEWRTVFSKIVEAIRNYGGPAKLASQTSRDKGVSPEFQFEKIADMFRPVCYQTGKCEFKANFDRKCSIRERVDAFEKAGIPSNAWGDGWHDYVGNHTLLPISPVEWLADPAAAR